MENPDPPPSLHPIDYAGLPAEPRLTPYWAAWAATLSVAMAISEVPWFCGPAWSAVGWVGGRFDSADRHGFVVGRIVMLGPTVLALLLAGVALLGRRPGRYRWAVLLTFVLAGMWLFLLWFAANCYDDG